MHIIQLDITFGELINVAVTKIFRHTVTGVLV
jgi:hypothetical protein